jgi:type IX secretion system PorP/SprF family membrane protein
MVSRKLFVSFILMVIMQKFLFAQDAAFSQFYANPLFLNPALTGSTECGRLHLNYRNQWPSISNAFVTYSVSYDQSLEAINSGFGFLVMADQQGDAAYSRTSVGGSYAYTAKLSNSAMLSFGIKAAYYQENLNWDKLIFAEQINTSAGNIAARINERPPNQTNVSTVDFGAGLMLAFDDMFFVGLSADHLTQPNLSFYNDPDSKLPFKLTAHAGTVINVSQGMIGGAYEGDILLQPNVLFQQQGYFTQLNAGLYAVKYPFVLGGWFRHNFENPDAAIVLAGLTWQNFRFAYSFDITLSQVGMPGGGAHEISFAWDFCIYRESKRRIRTIKSPSF